MSQLLTMSPTGDAATDTPGFVESRTLASLRDTLLLIAACAALGAALALQIHLGGTSLGGMR